MIHVDQILTARELFRVHLDLAKLRLLIGGTIVLFIIVITVWFFWMIDEGFILLELSPLFFGAPLVGFGGQLLRLHAACRKHCKKGAGACRQQFHFQNNADGYDVTSGDNYAHFVWRDVTKVIERRTYFLFYLSGIENALVLKSGFHQQQDLTLFQRLLAKELGEKARLLPTVSEPC